MCDYFLNQKQNSHILILLINNQIINEKISF